ncbi:MAG: DUF1385 domain-containing protein [Defluviitaleaceae bacterium]|nr:DUF1385 domain-containing protein [Defluviitaleaceae bacterium]MCL2263438.1 DUF1385 domain-containing protein [Defluviitaleaceae bacterium]
MAETAKTTTAKAAEPVYYGGQAVMEGVMMRGTKGYAMAVRKPNGEIAMIEKPLSTLTKRYPFLKWPLIRGVTALCSSMAVGFTSLSLSADIAFEGLEEEEPESRFEKWLFEKFGDKLNGIIKGLAMVFAVVLALGLFMLLPAFLGGLVPVRPALTGVIEGFLRIAIFVTYVFVISRSQDIQRVFQYHGAEHKAINCFESNLPLTHENVAASNRLHKRCGTSFMLVVMVITMILFMIIQVEGVWMRFASRILLLPLIAGLSYEVSVKWAGRRDNFLVRAIIFPGMLMQKMTTAEPDEKQIEIAVTALEKVLEQEKEEPAKGLEGEQKP